MTIREIVVNLEYEIVKDPEFLALMADDIFCAELWTAFANQDWRKVRFPDYDDAEVVAYRLQYESASKWDQWDIFSASFRGMGGFIATIRNEHHNMNEDYINWYCSNYTIKASYGDISDRVREQMARLGWEPCEIEEFEEDK